MPQISKSISVNNIIKSLYINLKANCFKVIFTALILSAVIYYKVASKALTKKINNSKEDETSELNAIINFTTCPPADIFKVKSEEYKKLKKATKDGCGFDLDSVCKVGTLGNAFFLCRRSLACYAKACVLYGDSKHPFAEQVKGFNDLIYIDVSEDKILNRITKHMAKPVPEIKPSSMVVKKKDLRNYLKKQATTMYSSDKAQVAILSLHQVNNLKEGVSQDMSKLAAETTETTLISESDYFHPIISIGSDIYVYCKDGILDKHNIKPADCF